ncbi:Gfo/Idh/MocA family protein [Leptolinea tardivitalis]|uniref:Dehydrogenase n=1 Tax=Leptolinea tardivitalis TaxID=229920 RepID=A0A0N8GLS8_9CHLR|nr:Gfo/Idh/MocA family oxidoreductase [Leptolinea tardivitalis]KPL73338.1 dehydrogenase [Leptolinea tardivitalis]GAP21475.1 predicted dehydrogenase [Leptolinea tardivitalis]
MDKKLKVGVIGTGFIGPIHIENARRSFKADVIALVEKDMETAREKAAKYDIPLVYDDYRDLLKNPDIDVVHICSPNSMHYAMARDTLLAGKHCLCEKPLTLTRTEADDLLAIAREKKLVNAVHFNVRYYPLIRHAREMIHRDDVGRIYALTGSYLQDWLFKDTDYSWRLESKISGPTRAIGDIGSHWLDLIEYVTGQEINEVMADFETFHKTRKKPLKPVETWSGKLLTNEDYQEVPIDTEDYATVMLRFKNGTKGVFTVNQMAAGHKNRVYFEINGSKCSLIWNSETPNELTVGHRDRGNEVIMRDPSLMYPEAREIAAYPGGHNEGFADASKHLFREVYDYILAGDMTAKPRFPTFEAGFREVVLCDAIVKSAKTGQWVKVL